MHLLDNNYQTEIRVPPKSNIKTFGGTFFRNSGYVFSVWRGNKTIRRNEPNYGV